MKKNTELTDEILKALARFGFRRQDIANRFGVSGASVSVRLKALGFPQSAFRRKRQDGPENQTWKTRTRARIEKENREKKMGEGRFYKPAPWPEE